MKLETAKKLAWPWECEKYFDLALVNKQPSPLPFLVKHGHPDFIPHPSVEEMLERMPENISILRMRNGYMVEFRKREADKFYYHMKENESISEALAQLCIWLFDNGLMERGK